MQSEGVTYFTLDGSMAVKDLINDSYEQALKGLEHSIEEGNTKRKEYWLDRITHLIGELNWIDNEIFKLEAVRPRIGKPPITITGT